jgi:serine protease Do
VVGIACAGATLFDGLAFGIPAADLIEFLVHRDAYLYDSSQPQNGITYLPPPTRESAAAALSKPEAAKNSPDTNAGAKGQP